MAKRRTRRDAGEPSDNGRTSDKIEKQNAKAEAKEAKILAKAELSKQKAAKRKWLVALIGIAIAGYLLLRGGAGSGLIESLKSKVGL